MLIFQVGNYILRSLVSHEATSKTGKHKRAVMEAPRPKSVEDVPTLLDMMA